MAAQNAYRRALIDRMAGDAPEPSQNYMPEYQPANPIPETGGYTGGGTPTLDAATTPAPQPAPAPAPAPSPAPAPAPVPTGAPGPDPFAAIGGGRLVNGGWVPLTAYGGNPPAGATGASTTPAAPSFGDQVRSQILAQMNQDPNAASINDPDLKPVADANRLALQRNQEQTRARLAEHYAASGYGSSGAMDSMIASGLENQGIESARFESQLVLQKLQQRREQVSQALQLGAGLLTEDQRVQLQAQLASIDAGIRNRSLDLQNQQFNDELGFRIGQEENRLNENAIVRLLLGIE